jgi:SAM-dependent methyltransferase
MPRLPLLTSHNWLVHWITERELERTFPMYLRGRLIDIGCGLKPYEQLASPFVSEHVGVDEDRSRHGTSRVDLTGSAYAIPAPDESFDSALCSAVLEHLEEPEQALRECFRVLRPGAHAIITVPLMWHLHEEPRDFFRYTRHGLNHLLVKAGFEVVEMVPLSGFWVSFGQMLTYMLRRRNHGIVRRTGILTLAGSAIQLASLGLDKVDRAEQWTWAYLAVAKKPG